MFEHQLHKQNLLDKLLSLQELEWEAIINMVEDYLPDNVAEPETYHAVTDNIDSLEDYLINQENGEFWEDVLESIGTFRGLQLAIELVASVPSSKQ